MRWALQVEINNNSPRSNKWKKNKTVARNNIKNTQKVSLIVRVNWDKHPKYINKIHMATVQRSRREKKSEIHERDIY